MSNAFSFFRLRLPFAALQPVRFAEGSAGNVFRGALGWPLREIAPESYAAWFAPKQARGTGPSGLADAPRPFVVRADHLNGRSFAPGETFTLDLHLFGSGEEQPKLFTQAFERAATRGFGPIRSRAQMGEVLYLDLDGNAVSERRRNVLRLEQGEIGISRLSVHFLTATELKAQAGLAKIPEFPILFARVRDRLRTLAKLYQDPLTLNFEGLTALSWGVQLVSHDLVFERRQRTSRQTGRAHPLGGFRGVANYAGSLAKLAPLLEAARWTGCGRQTVWGKGAISVSY